jgi:hypothetical protein
LRLGKYRLVITAQSLFSKPVWITASVEVDAIAAIE